MSLPDSPAEIVDRQLIAYNAHDLDAFCNLFSPDAEIVDLSKRKVLALGLDALRARYEFRFQNADLKCRVLTRLHFDDFVIDHERVVGLSAEPLDVLAIYEVRDSKIKTLRLLWPNAPSAAIVE